jgi:hypothetical protein
LQLTARERVQKESEAVVQKAVSDLSFAGQEVVRLQDSIREQSRLASELAEQSGQVARLKIQQVAAETLQQPLADLHAAATQAHQLQDSVREQARQIEAQVTGIAAQAAEQVRRAEARAAETLQQPLAELHAAAAQAQQLQSGIREQARQIEAQVAGIAAQASEQVRRAEAQAAELHAKAREGVRLASEEAIQQALERMRQEVTTFPNDLEQSCRVTITKLEEELDQKRSEMQHSAYESLLKASEWYQKKAQTSMQSTMERVIDQSANTLKERAGEVSSMVAAELDHYRRSYVEHGRVEVEEAAREVFDRERARLNETAEIANATFTDRMQLSIRDALHRFEESSRESVQKAHASMNASQDSSVEQFQKKLDEKMTQGVEQAATYLQSQLIPLIEQWEDKRQQEQQQWLEEMKKAADQSIETYRARLENTTNGWLLASAATLGQNSQAVLDSLSKNAERQIRETCSRVMAGMAGILSAQLLSISTSFKTEPEEPKE